MTENASRSCFGDLNLECSGHVIVAMGRIAGWAPAGRGGSVPDLFEIRCGLAKCLCSGWLFELYFGACCCLDRASAKGGDDVAVTNRAVDIPTIADVKESSCLVPSAVFGNDGDVINLLAPELSPKLSSAGKVGNGERGSHFSSWVVEPLGPGD